MPSLERLQDPDHRLEDDDEAAHRRRDGERHPLRVLERDALRNKLADDDVEERDDQERERKGDHRREDRVEHPGEHLLAESTNRQAGRRHAELHRGDEARRVGHDSNHRAGPAVALLRELLDSRPARGDQAVLGRHEIRVQQDQRRDAEEFQKKGHAPLSGARVLGGFSSNWIYVAV